uniref:Uncharacterized protein n=1 Tax=Marseillevirus LCMAC103 TaxID=2506604 RepID=A0A481YVD9_9VIRU|nr:MAG: hypothetical protein LCMAC103_00860 [Marseillevirus LCMAC103]
MAQYLVDYTVETENEITMYRLTIQNTFTNDTRHLSGWAPRQSEVEYVECRELIADLRCKQTTTFMVGALVCSFDSRTDRLAIGNLSLDLAERADCDHVADVLGHLVCHLAGAA